MDTLGSLDEEIPYFLVFFNLKVPITSSRDMIEPGTANSIFIRCITLVLCFNIGPQGFSGGCSVD